MKNRIKIAITLAAIMLMVLTSTVSAQYAGYSWSTAYQVVNMGTEATTIDIDYYNAQGQKQDAAHLQYTNVPPGGSRLVVQFTDDKNLQSGRYSAVISAGQPIAAIANQQLVASGATSYNPAPPFSTYSGESQGSSQVTLPAIMNNWYGYYTDVFIMNVGGGTASKVDITYVPGKIGANATGATGVTDLNNSIPQYATLEKNNNDLATLKATSGPYVGRFLGTAIVTSDQPIIAVVNQHNVSASKLMTYNGFSAGSLSIAAPVHMKGYFGYYTTLLVGNPSATESAHVRLTYTPTGTFNVANTGSTVAPFSVEYDIPAQTSLTRYDGPNASADQSDLQSGTHSFSRFYGSVQVESTNNVPVVVQVNEEAVATGDDQAGSYNGISVDSATQDIVVPVIAADYYGYYTTMVVQNATGETGSCDVTYTSDATYSAIKNHSATYTHDLPAGGNFTVYEGRKGNQETGDINHDTQWRSGNAKQFIGAASIHCTVKALSIVNEESDISQKDSMYTFNTFNK